MRVHAAQHGFSGLVLRAWAEWDIYPPRYPSQLCKELPTGFVGCPQWGRCTPSRQVWRSCRPRASVSDCI